MTDHTDPRPQTTPADTASTDSGTPRTGAAATKGVPGALLRYRVMAYVVGCLLIVLVCIGMPLKYLADNSAVVAVAGPLHGFLYMVLIVTAFDLGLRVKWPWSRLGLIALAGTVPFLSFVAERFATKNVHAWLAARR